MRQIAEAGDRGTVFPRGDGEPLSDQPGADHSKSARSSLDEDEAFRRSASDREGGGDETSGQFFHDIEHLISKLQVSQRITDAQ